MTRYVARILFTDRWYVYDQIYRRVVLTDLSEERALAEAKRLNGAVT